MKFNEIGNLIRENNDFAIVSHTSPDGDSLGSILGLSNCLREIGKNADVFIEDSIPDKYSFLPGSDLVKNIDLSKEKYDCIFVLDCGDEDRLGNCRELIFRSNIIVNIDHHLSNNMFGKINVVDANASSVGEMIYQIIKDNGMEVTKDTATCLFTSILTDTGGFKYSNTTSLTMNIAGNLIDLGVDFSDINNRVFDIKTIPQVMLLSRVTSTLKMCLDGRCAVLSLSRDMMDECNACEEDASDFVNIARDISEVEVGIFIKEKDIHSCRVSLRSKKLVDVRKVAEYFGGGGHLRASGCTVEGSICEVFSKIIDKIESIMEVK